MKLEHISESTDLITTYEETRAGFISMALEKNRQAGPLVEEAKVLRNRVSDISSPEELIKLGNIRPALISAAGISEKASRHLGEDGCDEAIKLFIRDYLLPAGNGFRDELVYRFLLTKGDSLGGSLRNLVGSIAKKRVVISILASLKLSGIRVFWNQYKSLSWKLIEPNFDGYDLVKGLSWKNQNNESRLLLFDTKVGFIGNNIDMILLRNHNNLTKEAISYCLGKQENYVGLGEIKGGIDPAGADEHWKTAKTALDRIYKGFEQSHLSPKIFFVGAAIESRMAEEIFELLNSDYLDFAVNLTKDAHLAYFSDWLIEL